MPSANSTRETSSLLQPTIRALRVVEQRRPEVMAVMMSYLLAVADVAGKRIPMKTLLKTDAQQRAWRTYRAKSAAEQQRLEGRT